MLIGSVLTGVGLALNSFPIALLGVPFFAVIPPLLFLPLWRDIDRRPRGNGGYRDQGFLGGFLTVFGVSPTEQYAAASEAKLRRSREAK